MAVSRLHLLHQVIIVDWPSSHCDLRKNRQDNCPSAEDVTTFPGSLYPSISKPLSKLLFLPSSLLSEPSSPLHWQNVKDSLSSFRLPFTSSENASCKRLSLETCVDRQAEDQVHNFLLPCLTEGFSSPQSCAWWPCLAPLNLECCFIGFLNLNEMLY